MCLKATIKISFLLLLVLCAGSAWAQSREELEKQRKQKLEEIAFTQKLIDQTGEAQKKNLNYLIIINRQIKNREQLIVTEHSVLKMLTRSIDQTELFILALESDINTLKEEYIEMAYFAFKNRSSYDYLLYIFASESLQEAWNRMRYIRFYNEIRTNQIELIKSTQQSLSHKITNLKSQINSKKELLENLELEKQKLQRDKTTKNEILGELKGKEKEFKDKLKEDQRIAKELDKAIEEIITAEIAKNENLELSGLSSNEFASNRNHFIWPANGIVSKGFGKQEHPTIPNVFINNFGIDIRTEKGAVVRAVFSGVVSHVIFIPGADNAIIIQHGEYYTVYKNLINVKVNTGDTVKEGQELGTVSYDENKEIAELHFEMRYLNEKLDPQLWLKKK
ncbi:peptidoglycan DD-metalloendopeptidase family protein [bacterium]|nr:peptidoglycan DD-metalloendopeptidase family protein [bacterium]